MFLPDFVFHSPAAICSRMETTGETELEEKGKSSNGEVCESDKPPPFIPSTFHAGTQACMEEQHELCTVEVTGLNPGNVLRKQVWRN